MTQSIIYDCATLSGFSEIDGLDKLNVYSFS